MEEKRNRASSDESELTKSMQPCRLSGQYSVVARSHVPSFFSSGVAGEAETLRASVRRVVAMEKRMVCCSI